MPRTPRSLLRPLFTAAAMAAVLALPPVGAAPASTPAGGYAVEITTIDVAAKRLTFKASMGQQTMRVAPGVALAGLQPGDKVRVTFGQEGAESVITGIEVIAKH